MWCGAWNDNCDWTQANIDDWLPINTTCDQDTGLPWRSHDGCTLSLSSLSIKRLKILMLADGNPIGANQSRAQLDRFREAVVPLTVAGFYTKQDKYMRRVALLFRTFFCDPGDATTSHLVVPRRPGCAP